MSVQIDSGGVRLYDPFSQVLTNLTTTGNITTQVVEVIDGNIYINANTTGEATLYMRASNASTFDTTKTAVIGINEQGVGIKEGAIVIDNNDHVGIGTTSPDYLLDVRGSGNSYMQISSNGEQHDAGLYFRTPNVSDTSAKAAIIAQAKDDYSRSNFHFCLDDNADNDGSFIADYNTNARMTILSGGNVGIGEKNPSMKLQVNGDILGGTLYANDGIVRAGRNTSVNDSLRLSSGLNDEAYILIYNSRPPQESYISFNTRDTGGTNVISEKMRITKNGNVGIGTNNPNYNLEITGTSGLLIHSGSISNANIRLKTNNAETRLIVMENDGDVFFGILDIGSVSSGDLYQRAQSDIFFQTGGSNTRMTITSGGNVGIGTTSPSYPLHVTKTFNEANSGYIKYQQQGSGSNVKYETSTETYQISIWATGNIATEKHYLQISDRRIKQNIQEIDDETALSQLRQFKPCKYTYIDTLSRTNREVIGFIAQEVKEVIPHAVSDSNTQTIPSIYSFSNCSIISPNEIQIEHTDIDNITLSDRIQFYAPNVSTEFIGNVTNISTGDQTYTLTLDDTNHSLDNVSASNVFVYGKEVYDFHLMAKEHIFTVATAALQELDRQVQNLTIEKAKLQDQITHLTLEYQNRFESLEARLAALES